MASYVTLGIIILMTVIEITPIKINPISWLGNKLNKDVIDKLHYLEEKVDMNDIDTIRNRILANETLIRKGEHLKMYQYKSIFKDIDKWRRYHIKYPELNGIIDVAIENITEAYKNEKFDK